MWSVSMLSVTPLKSSNHHLFFPTGTFICCFTFPAYGRSCELVLAAHKGTAKNAASKAAGWACALLQMHPRIHIFHRSLMLTSGNEIMLVDGLATAPTWDRRSRRFLSSQLADGSITFISMGNSCWHHFGWVHGTGRGGQRVFARQIGLHCSAQMLGLSPSFL